MCYKSLLLFLFLFISSFSFSQKVQVIDSVNGEILDKVYIYNEDKNIITQTDYEGYFDFSLFRSLKHITLQHYGYKNKQVFVQSFQGKVIKLEPEVIGLESIVISANKWEANLAEVPNQISSLSANQIQYSNPQTMADVISSSGKVFVQKSQMGGGSPMIRGFAANSILLVLDGVRMNNLIYRSGNLQNIISIDPNFIDKTEVIFGPGSILYGSDALGGVIDMHTKSPKISGNNKTSAHALLRYATANKEKTAYADANYEFGSKWGFLTSLSFTDYEDLKMGSHQHDDYQRETYTNRINNRDTILINNSPNIQRETGYRQYNFMQKIRYRANDKLNFNYQLIFSNTSDIPRYDRLIMKKGDGLKYAQWYYGPQKFLMNSISMSYIKNNLIFNRFKINLTHQNIEESRHDRKFGNDYLRSRTEKVNTYNLYADFEKDLTETSFLFYGFEGIANTLVSSGIKKNIITLEEKDQASRYPEGDNFYSHIGLYALYKNNYTPQLTFQSGLRYSHISLKSTFDNVNNYQFPFDEIKLNTGSLTGNIGLVFRTSNNWSFHINGASGFRAPNVDDMAKVFDSEPGTIIVPNSNLESEYAYSGDITIKKSFSKNGSIEATGFYTYLDNAMVRRDFTFNGQDSIMYDGALSKVSALVNTGYANIYGASFYGKLLLINHFKLYGNITFTDGEDDENYPIRHVAPTFVQAGLSYFNKPIKIDLFMNYNASISYDDLASSERKKTYMYASDSNGNPYSPSWWTLNIKSNYQLNSHLALQFGIENIFDVRYRPYSSGIVSAGRNFVFSLRGNF